MQLIFIRHAIAEDPKEFALTGRPDAQRPLTDDGVEKMKRGVKGLREVVPEINLIATSPYVRAVETAKIVGAAYKDPKTVIIHELVAVVGHEPHLSEVASWLLTGQPRSVIDFKKGAALAMEFEGVPAGGTGVLMWALTPRQMRRLAVK
jgi:phosphohistidine phosphatase